MNLLIDPEVKQYSRLLAIDLSYNTISLLVQNSVKKLLTETQYATSHNSRLNQHSQSTGGVALNESFS